MEKKLGGTRRAALTALGRASSARRPQLVQCLRWRRAPASGIRQGRPWRPGSVSGGASPARERLAGVADSIDRNREDLPRRSVLVLGADVLSGHAIDEREVMVRLDVDDTAAD